MQLCFIFLKNINTLIIFVSLNHVDQIYYFNKLISHFHNIFRFKHTQSNFVATVESL